MGSPLVSLAHPNIRWHWPRLYLMGGLTHILRVVVFMVFLVHRSL